MKLTACLFASALLAAPLAASAQDDAVTITEKADGGFTVEGDVPSAIEASAAGVKLASGFGKAMTEAFGRDAAVNYEEGLLFKGPQTITIARDDGTAAYYQVEGDVYAFPAPDTLREGDAMNSLTGVVVFEADLDGRIVFVADSGAISMISG